MLGPGDGEDDNSFFAPSSSTKLSSIFQTSEFYPVEDNKSLTYSAPRPPSSSKSSKNHEITPKSRKGSPSSSKTPSKVALLKMVYGYKYINELYDPLGKLGLAFVEYPSISTYHIILYKNPSQHIFNVRLHSKIQFTIQDNKYLTFYDDLKQNWSLLFENDDDLLEFRSKLDEIGIKVMSNLSKEVPSIEKVELPAKSKSELLSSILLQDDSDNESTTKADILSRMARMGQQVVFPLITKTNIQSDATDSDKDTDSSSRKTRSIKTRSKAGQDFKPVGNELAKRNSNHSSIISTDSGALSDYEKQLAGYMSQAQSQNEEVKMNINKLENKIDRIYERLRTEEELAFNKKILELQYENEKLRLDLQRKELERQNNLPEIQKRVEPIHSEIDSTAATETFKNNKEEVYRIQKKYSDTIDGLNDLLTVNHFQKSSIQKLKTKYSILPLCLDENDPQSETVGDDIQEVAHNNYTIHTQLESLIDKVRGNTMELNLEMARMQDIEDFFIELDKTVASADTSTQGKLDLVGIMKNKMVEYNRHYKKSKELENQLEHLAASVKVYQERLQDEKQKISRLEKYYKELETKTIQQKDPNKKRVQHNIDPKLEKDVNDPINTVYGKSKDLDQYPPIAARRKSIPNPTISKSLSDGISMGDGLSIATQTSASPSALLIIDETDASTQASFSDILQDKDDEVLRLISRRSAKDDIKPITEITGTDDDPKVQHDSKTPGPDTRSEKSGVNDPVNSVYGIPGKDDTKPGLKTDETGTDDEFYPNAKIKKEPGLINDESETDDSSYKFGKYGKDIKSDPDAKIKKEPASDEITGTEDDPSKFRKSGENDIKPSSGMKRESKDGETFGVNDDPAKFGKSGQNDTKPSPHPRMRTGITSNEIPDTDKKPESRVPTDESTGKKSDPDTKVEEKPMLANEKIIDINDDPSKFRKVEIDDQKPGTDSGLKSDEIRDKEDDKPKFYFGKSGQDSQKPIPDTKVEKTEVIKDGRLGKEDPECACDTTPCSDLKTMGNDDDLKRGPDTKKDKTANDHKEADSIAPKFIYDIKDNKANNKTDHDLHPSPENRNLTNDGIKGKDGDLSNFGKPGIDRPKPANLNKELTNDKGIIADDPSKSEKSGKNGKKSENVSFDIEPDKLNQNSPSDSDSQVKPRKGVMTQTLLSFPPKTQLNDQMMVKKSEISDETETDDASINNKNVDPHERPLTYWCNRVTTPQFNFQNQADFGQTGDDNVTESDLSTPLNVHNYDEESKMSGMTAHGWAVSDNDVRIKAPSKIIDYEREIDHLKNKINFFQDQVKVLETFNATAKEKLKKNIAPAIKEEMNELYSELQAKIKEDCQIEVTSIIVQATYKIIQTIESHTSLETEHQDTTSK